MANVKKYLLLNSENQVVNAILYDGESSYQVPQGYSLELAVEGAFYDIGTYKLEDGLFYYKHSDGSLHLQKEEQPEV